MGIIAQFVIENADVVKAVDTDFPVGMDDLIVAEQYAYVDDIPLIIVEKGEVASGSFLNKANELPYFSLLLGCARQLYAIELKGSLHQGGIINTEGGLSTCEVRHVEVLQSGRHNTFAGHFLGGL